MARLEQQARHKDRERELLDAGVPPLVAYWEARYAAAGTSGAGSAGDAAKAKAAYVNDLIHAEQVESVVDWGCGDGQQLDLLDLPAYLGVDISPSAIGKCLARHPGRAFLVWPGDQPEVAVRADLAMSLDVIFHLVDDDDFAAYWGRLFASAARLVLVHGTDFDGTSAARHVRHRRHTHLAPDGWTLADRPADPAVPGFYLWRRR
jgi:SAM-dependent methyltransferase